MSLKPQHCHYITMVIHGAGTALSKEHSTGCRLNTALHREALTAKSIQLYLFVSEHSGTLQMKNGAIKQLLV